MWRFFRSGGGQAGLQLRNAVIRAVKLGFQPLDISLLQRQRLGQIINRPLLLRDMDFQRLEAV